MSAVDSAKRMNPEVKARWVAALRSGKYAQTRETLRDNTGHCCLGVLCDLYAQEKLGGGWAAGLLGASSGAVPSQYVVDWAGLPDPNPTVRNEGSETCLAQLNDSRRMSFAQIADHIEQQL